MSNHYVDNAKFLQALKDYRTSIKDAGECGDAKPRISNYIGECILKIATHLSYRPNFINYTFRDEMVSDGIENCLMYVDNFDPDKSSNPFAYFTQIIYFAFIRRIQKEKKQTLIKGRIIMDMPADLFELQEQDEDGVYTSSYVEFVQSHGIYDSILAEEKKRSPRVKKLATLDDIIESNQITDGE